MEHPKRKFQILSLALVLVLAHSVTSCNNDDDATTPTRSIYETIDKDEIVKRITENPDNVTLRYTMEVADVFLYKTNENHYGKLEVLQIDNVDGSFILTIKATTYNDDGSILSKTSTNNLTVLDSFYCDLDTMEKNALSSEDGDFIWEGENQVIEKNGSAVFLEYKVELG